MTIAVDCLVPCGVPTYGACEDVLRGKTVHSIHYGPCLAELELLAVCSHGTLLRQKFHVNLFKAISTAPKVQPVTALSGLRLALWEVCCPPLS